jgi:hypothetical protein
MDDDALGAPIALALAAGALAAKRDKAAAAIKDRHSALKRAISRVSEKSRVGEVDEDPSSADHRAALAKDLEEHGASKDKDVIVVARELLALIKVDDDARTAASDLIGDVETALIKLSQVEIEPGSAPAPKRPLESTRSRSEIPLEAHSKTELERLALPIWKRTERFFTKAAIVAGVVVFGSAGAWLSLRTSPSEPLEACRNGEKARCWEIVAAEDSVERGQRMSSEPLRLLCDKHQDPCACAGLAYVSAAETESLSDCSGFAAASALDPKWACTCRPYDFWRWGRQRTSHCGIPRCE